MGGGLPRGCPDTFTQIPVKGFEITIYELDDLDFILNYLLEELHDHRQMIIPSDLTGKRRLMRLCSYEI